MTDLEIAQMFEDVANLLSIRGDNRRRVLAYQRAAEVIRELDAPLETYASQNNLTAIAGIGKTLAAKIDEMLTTGELDFYNRLSAEIPPSLLTLLRVNGVGPKKVKLFFDSLDVRTLDDLEAAAKAEKLRRLPGMGAKSEAKILQGIDALRQFGDERRPLWEVWPLAQAIVAHLRTLPGVQRAEIAGSLRRRRDTIGDLDFLVAAAAEDAPAIMDAFVAMRSVSSVSGRGPTKSSVLLHDGIRADLRVLPAERWGTLLAYFTGSQAHNVRLRELAQRQGYTLNEHALTPLDGRTELIFDSEADLYARLELPYILPTLREDRGEIEAAQNGQLPAVVTQGDIVSDLHMHSTWSDGKHTILEMAHAARERGLKLIVITDHSYSLGIANGLSAERLRDQAAAVRAADAEIGPEMRILHGTEMEIRADGTLDFPDELLETLDFVIASLHVSLTQPRAQIMQRLLAAVDNPHVDMIAHPTGRLIGERPGADVDLDRLFMAASATGTLLEINANPRRLDLSDQAARRAAQLGVKISINCDAHRAEQFDLLHFGVAAAQRAWLTPANIVNCWPVTRLVNHLGLQLHG